MTDQQAGELGPIARSYAELQSLPALFDAVRRAPVPAPGTSRQATRALLQAIEVAVAALEHLALETAERAARGDARLTLKSLSWMRAFARAWTDLAWRIGDVAARSEAHAGDWIDLRSSSNWVRLSHAESVLGPALSRLLDDAEPSGYLDDIRHGLLHFMMLERAALEYTTLHDATLTYDELVRPAEIRAALLDRALSGDTTFTQFRAAHQMPEILVDAVNDHIEAAIRLLDEDDPATALDTLLRADRMLDAVVLLADLLVSHLSSDDYHEIRTYLGLTSGSHSTGLHYHLMGDLYPALVDVVNRRRDAKVPGPWQDVMAHVAGSIGRHIDRWRLAHINLPRANLGAAGAQVRSLTGSPDALRTVTRMRDAALAKDGLNHAPQAIRATDWDSRISPLQSLEARLLEETADKTRARFPDVQSRTGRFAATAAFRAPPERKRQDGSRTQR